MKKLSLLSGLCLGALLAGQAAGGPSFNPQPAGINFYVSPSGDDANNGQDVAHPFRTPWAAQAVVRKHPERGQTPITIHLMNGAYVLGEAWNFMPADSGAKGAPVTWQAYMDHRPVISGGRIITGWKVGDDGIWSVRIPETIGGNKPDGKWNIMQLFVNGERRQRCRLPKQGFFRMKDRAVQWKDRQEAAAKPGAHDSFIFRDGDIENWPDVSNATIMMYNSWTASIHWIDSIDFEKKTLKFTSRMGWPVGYWDRQGRYHLENLRAALTDAGEWYMDYMTGTLHYKPMPGETPDNTTVVAPVHEQLLVIKGDGELGLPVEYLNFRGISFQYGAFLLNTSQSHDGQAAAGMTAAVYASDARDCVFSDIDISHSGIYGIWLAKGCQRNMLIRSELHDLGGGGIRIGEPGGEQDATRACGHNLVENCFIHNAGLVAPAAVGAIIFKSSYNTLRHNEISDLYYSAVSVGWSWGYAPSTANHNIVEYNHLHHLGYGVLSDMGAIYNLGISPGTVFRGNHIHDVFSHSYGGWGLYTDEGSTGVLMEHNVVYNTKSGGFHQHYGKDNILRNNLLAFAQEGQIIRSRQEDHISFTAENNVVIFNNGRPYGGNWGNNQYVMRNNLYWDTTGLPFGFNGSSLADLQEFDEQELGSVVADPKFVDAEHFNFALQSDSPVKPYIQAALDAMKIAGLTGPSWWTEKAKHQSFKEISTSMVPISKERPKIGMGNELVIDFAQCKVGDQCPNGHTSGDVKEKGTSIRVTDELDAPGSKKCLKFIDAPGWPVIWEPHLVFGFNWRKGKAIGEFDVFLKTPTAILHHEWRDSSAPYKVGPTMRFYGDGRLTWLDKPLGGVPIGKWFHVRILTMLGNAIEKPVFTLEITPDGGETQTYANLDFGSPDWRQLTWLGFISEADTNAEFMIGNIRFRREK
ncbi:MAG: right-handed parallel beta-helix repeat-containing protein [Victivallales bacterium]|nr:right-handed parallel beta-helix repeat-containing protein [Victivallales bacterium]